MNQREAKRQICELAANELAALPVGGGLGDDDQCRYAAARDELVEELLRRSGRNRHVVVDERQLTIDDELALA